MYSAVLSPRDAVTHPLQAGRHAWVQVVRGSVELNHLLFGAGDGTAISEEAALEFRSSEHGEALLFDLA